MMNNKLELRNWRKQRNISKPKHRVLFANVLEELLEPLYHKDEIPAMVKEIMDLYYPEEHILDEYEVIDSLTDIRVFAENETENMGYDSELCMSEVIKEISSRRQCPEQEERWDIGVKEDGEKWLKDKEQPKDTLYKADFSSCKI